jgi:hypothetical protein
MGRLKTPTLAIVALLLFISLPSFLSDTGAGTNTPTINAKYTWSYHLQSTDGTTTKDGTMSATVSKVQWNGGPAYKFDGSLSGTFQTSAGSGTESGTWREYYGNLSLDYMDHMEVIDLVTGGNTVTNTTQVNYNPPLRWIKNRPPTTMDPWSQTDVKVLNTVLHLDLPEHAHHQRRSRDLLHLSDQGVRPGRSEEPDHRLLLQ